MAGVITTGGVVLRGLQQVGSAPAPDVSLVLEANRTQVLPSPADLESPLPADHPARTLWACLERLVLTPLYAAIAAVKGAAG